MATDAESDTQDMIIPAGTTLTMVVSRSDTGIDEVRVRTPLTGGDPLRPARRCCRPRFGPRLAGPIPAERSASSPPSQIGEAGTQLTMRCLPRSVAAQAAQMPGGLARRPRARGSIRFRGRRATITNCQGNEKIVIARCAALR